MAIFKTRRHPWRQDRRRWARGRSEYTTPVLDGHAAKLLQLCQHLVVDGCPGLRLVATSLRKTWTYRYKTLGSDRMKQVAQGH